MFAQASKRWVLVYCSGIISPVVMELLFLLLEKTGSGAVVGRIGIAWTALLGFALCLAGIWLSQVSVKKRFLLLVVALLAIPVEFLGLGLLFLLKEGLAGIQ